jgi:LAS superfamily LD-carboxypeptidase LdcB
VADLRGQVKEQALSAYIGGRPEVDDIGDPNASTAVVKDALLRFRAGQDTALLDQLRAADEDATTAQAAAEANASLAQQKRAEAAERTGAVRAARVPRGGSGVGASFGSGNLQLTTVRGITVASSIADNLERMLAAAEADGMAFSGTGYRDSAQQQALRNANCPNPATDPPSACSPPTARPGSSNHERGLAIDFRYGGSLIQSRSSPGFQWLAAHAATYGFYNLPSEPWHWSVDGN